MSTRATVQGLFHNDGCALIIGVNDYSAFDASGALNLQGSANDAASVSRLCEALGMQSDKVHVVATDNGAANEDQTFGTFLKTTTQKAIDEQLDWLKEQLADGKTKGLLWYSGHGAHSEKNGLMLCPSDTQTDFTNAIPFKTLKAKLGDAARKNLTVVLDCCHSGSGADALGRMSTSLGGNPEDGADDDLDMGAVVLTACDVGETSQQSQFASHSHGAFTWALLSVVDQWKKSQQGHNVRFGLTYRELIKKATLLLDSLEFSGTPQIHPRSAGGLAVLQQGNAAAEKTSEMPDAKRAGIQLDPNLIIGRDSFDYSKYRFTLYDSSSNLIGWLDVLSVGKASWSYSANNEYWLVKAEDAQTFLSKWSAGSASSCGISTTSSNWADAPGDPYGGIDAAGKLNAQVSWSALVGDRRANTQYVGDIGICVSDYTAPTQNATGSATVTWYRYLATKPDDNTYAISADATLTSTAPRTDVNKKWYKNEQTITIPMGTST